jgi:plastocyanin
MLIRMLALAAFAPLMLLAACGGDDDNATTTPKASQTAAPVGTNPASAKDITITAADFSLTPAAITASAGQVINITLNNTGNAEHSFTVGSTDVAEAQGGESGSGSFTASAQTVEFHCKYHSTMKGTITISGSSSSNLGTIPATASPAPAGISGIGY